jgi:hypothetical protein
MTLEVTTRLERRRAIKDASGRSRYKRNQSDQRFGHARERLIGYSPWWAARHSRSICVPETDWSIAMSAMTLNLPESIQRRVEELAQRDGVSVDQFVATAVAEKLSALATVDYLAERAKRGSRDKFDAVLAKVPDREPEPHDRL